MAKVKKQNEVLSEEKVVVEEAEVKEQPVVEAPILEEVATVEEQPTAEEQPIAEETAESEQATEEKKEKKSFIDFCKDAKDKFVAWNDRREARHAVKPDIIDEEWNEGDLLKVRNLRTSFFTENGEVKAVDGVSFSLNKGKVLGIVGESGSGKSVTAYSIMQILSYPGRIVGGSVKLNNEELIGMPESKLQKIRGNKVSIIFQDPMTSLNPVYTIGSQLTEAIRLHTNRDHKQAKERAIELLRLVGINDPEKRLKQYPHELSGGMRQRVMIAMALACEPDILIADEPTTALDVTIQAQILELMQKLQKELGMAIIMITHDLGVIAQMCDEVIVMYAGKICEQGTADEIFYNPRHEYTKGLLASIPYGNKTTGKLSSIEGTPVDLLALPQGCAFAPRCKNCLKICLEQKPERMVINDDHMATCWINVRDGLADGTVEIRLEEKTNDEEGTNA